MSNLTDKLTGKVKLVAGRAAHNKRLETQGKIQYEMAQFREKAESVMRLLRESNEAH